MAAEQKTGEHAPSDPEASRRDFLMIASAAFAAVGAGAVAWPMIDQMNPDASALALSTTEVDLTPIAEGQAITVMWRGKPVFVRHRTAKEIQEAEAVKVDELRDNDSRNLGLPKEEDAEDKYRVQKGKEQWLVLVGVCTHLGCIPKGQGLGDARGDYGGWFCPCHGSHYDTAGRIRQGPAPQNLPVPPYTFLTDTKILIG